MKPQAQIFLFKGHTFDNKTQTATFKYQIDFANAPSLKFKETIIFPKSDVKLSATTQEKILNPLELILGISYYKLYCPPKIQTTMPLDKDQAEFWHTVYKKGLGEFLYRNNLPFSKIAKFPHKNIECTPERIKTKDSALLGIGGGKDSIVAAELLKENKKTLNISVRSLLIETQKEDPISTSVAKKIGNPIVKIKRFLDPQIFQKHEGAYNGHIPISAIFAFLGLATAAMQGHKYMIVGNEHSSNFGNIIHKGETINHQWSKSMEFEEMLQNYTRKYISPDIQYFSLLRQFYEIRIAKMFSRHQKYFQTFSSCNRNFKVYHERPNSLWCGECPKCAFVFLMLSAFLNKKVLVKMFQKNLFEDEKLIPLFNDLLGFGALKPFDCVGTFEESKAAMTMAAQKYANTIVIKTLSKKITNGEKYREAVMRTAKAPTLPTPFRFLGINTICILGYGREGHVTETYLKKNYPGIKISILDQQNNPNYLDEQNKYDLAVKTPGIPKTLVTIPYVTATNIFFAYNKNFTIGVTGTKGKSTTVSLIYQILKSAKKNVELVGNIGNPMLKELLKKTPPKKIYVIELSSYMLDDIEYSPNIALLLNLFPEHMNYHGNVKNYYEAKKNIFKFQKPGDIKVTAPFKAKIPVSSKDIPLLGAHNRKNIQAAIQTITTLKIETKAIQEAIQNFQSLPHRLERVGQYREITFYDDAISTTPESTIMAIRSIPKVDTIFLGGEDRGYDFHELEKTLRAHKISNIVLFPESGKRILSSKKGFKILQTRDMKEAVAFAYKHTKPGYVCLLSTASPSYSVWKNFEEKGDLFQKYIKQLK